MQTLNGKTIATFVWKHKWWKGRKSANLYMEQATAEEKNLRETEHMRLSEVSSMCIIDPLIIAGAIWLVMH